jgi:hypothetical protein
VVFIASSDDEDKQRSATKSEPPVLPTLSSPIFMNWFVVTHYTKPGSGGGE